MKYICEICNKLHDTQSEAERCELKHKREEAEASARSHAESKISDAINAFITKYGEAPNIKLSGESHAVVLTSVTRSLDGIFETLFDTFLGDDDEGECCCSCEKTDKE